MDANGGAVNLNWRGHRFVLLGERALLWQDTSTLILSDVHLGKAHEMQTRGMPVPATVHTEDVQRMRRLLESYNPSRVFVLGDFVHSHRAPLEDLVQEFRAMKAGHPARWTLTVGNHDRPARSKLQAWGFDEIAGEIMDRGIRFSHGHSSAEGPSVSGHLHPVYKLGRSRDRMRLACFWVREHELTLPSFGEFTGGFEIRPAAGDQVFVVADREVYRI